MYVKEQKSAYNYILSWVFMHVTLVIVKSVTRQNEVIERKSYYDSSEYPLWIWCIYLLPLWDVLATVTKTLLSLHNINKHTNMMS